MRVRSQNRRILITVTVFSFFLHGLAIYSLQFLQMEYRSGGKHLLEHQLFLGVERETVFPEDVRRNEQLKKTFAQLHPVPTEERSLEFYQPEIEDDFQNYLSTEVIIDVPIEERLTVELPDLIDPMVPLQGIPKHEFVYADILFSHDNEVANTLIQATTVAKGIVELMPEDTYESLQVGKEAILEEWGNFFEERSGLIDQGRLDIIEGNNVTLTLAKEDFTPILSLNGSEHTFNQNFLKNTRQEFHLKESSQITSSKDFNVEVEYIPNPHGKGYFFQLALVPKEGVTFKRINHCINFLLDRSHSIPSKRYEVAKEGIFKALKYFEKGDHFNILVFDKKVVKLSETPLEYNEDNIRKAKIFLEKQKYGGVFASTDIYASLEKIIPKSISENEVNTAILVSDGDTYLKHEQQRKAIGRWTKKNGGKIALYCVTSGNDNNLPLLDLLSTLNKGTLYYTKEDQDIGDFLQKIIQSIRNPIGKDIIITAIPIDADSKITLYPSSQNLPNLYADKPYVLYGYIDQPKDFHLFLQGRYYHQWLDLKQMITFNDTYLENSTYLKKMIPVHQAYESYRKYLIEGNLTYLTEARNRLTPHKIPLAL